MSQFRTAAAAFSAAGLLLAAVAAQGVVNRSLLAAPETPAADGLRTGPVAIVDAASPSVAHVYVEVDGPRGKFKIERSSSGVVVDATGLVLTWHHLVAEAVGAADKRIFVQLNDASNTCLPAEIVRHDAATGLALMRIAAPERGLQAIELGPDRPRPGEGLVLVARPEGEAVLAFAGVASSALMPVTVHGAELGPDAVCMTDARNDERCDGALAVDRSGRLLGLFGSEHVQQDKSEPTLADLQRPSFGVVVNARTIRRAFAEEFGTGQNVTLRQAPAAAECRTARATATIAPAVVSVMDGAGELPAFAELDPGASRRRDGLGSGVIVSKRGLVVTNGHLVGSGRATVRTMDGQSFPAKIVDLRPAMNLALLQCELPAGVTLPAAEFAADGDVVVGETVVAVGNPFAAAPVVSAGVISAIRNGGRIQADADLGNPNAGGAVVDLDGRVLGIVDGGIVDPLELAFLMRGDRVTKESNLSTFVGMRAVRHGFRRELAELADPTESIVAQPSATPDKRATPLTRMIEAKASAMLNIYIAENVAVPDPDDPFASMAEPELEPRSLGSGVIIDRSGLALSNWHVVDAAVNPDGSPRADHVITARVYGGKTYAVEVLAISREDDLSLIRLVLEPGEEVPAIELSSSSDLPIGAAVAAIGNPHGQANTITYGVVSKKGHFTRVRGRWAKLGPLIETDAAINGGNSGGALVDMQGRLVGINSAGGGTFTNRGFAIEVDHVRDVLIGKLFSPYKLRSADLGMRVLDDEGKVLVMDVDDRGPAARVGVRGGDRIVSLAGTDITWGPGFALTLRELPANEPVKLVVERDGERHTFEVAPIGYAEWVVVKQSNLHCRTFGYRENADRARAAAIALHRELTGDATGAPPVIPETFVIVERTFKAGADFAIELQPQDLLLAVELPGPRGRVVTEQLRTLEQLRDLFNDRTRGKKDGVDHYKVPAEYTVLIDRAGKLERVKVRARRLLW